MDGQKISLSHAGNGMAPSWKFVFLVEDTVGARPPCNGHERRWQATATDDRREEPRGRIQKPDATRFKRMRTRQQVASPMAAVVNKADEIKGDAARFEARRTLKRAASPFVGHAGCPGSRSSLWAGAGLR